VDALARAAGARLAERAAALPEGALVGLAAANGPGFLASLLALWRAGLAALFFDPQTPAAERQRTARALGARALLDCRTGWPAGPEDWTLAEVGDSERAPAELPGIAVVKLTSGSTGAPRGIATPAEALVADDAALAATMGIGPDDRLLAAIPLSHSYGLSSLALPALVRGTPLVLADAGDPFGPFAAAAAAGATVFPTVPAYLNALLAVSQPPAWPRTLRLVVSAGAPLPPATAARFRATFGLPVHVFYGASECGGICYDREGGAGERGTVGAPVDGARVELAPLDEGGGAAGRGVVRVESAAVAAGYLPEPDPRLCGGRFTTGDLAAWEGGELRLLGRVDDLINIKGRKVDPREVEGVLARLAGVEEVAVVGLPLAGAEPVLRAVVACRGGLAAEEVLAWCRAHLAPHKVPRSLVLVPALPRTERGKLDRAALLAPEMERQNARPPDPSLRSEPVKLFRGGDASRDGAE
jgi:long-chain acyl-CoA synthetase